MDRSYVVGRVAFSGNSDLFSFGYYIWEIKKEMSKNSLKWHKRKIKKHHLKKRKRRDRHKKRRP